MQVRKILSTFSATNQLAPLRMSKEKETEMFTIDQLEKLCQEDERWAKEGASYHFHEEIIEEERVFDVVIDIKNNKASTKFLKW